MTHRKHEIVIEMTRNIKDILLDLTVDTIAVNGGDRLPRGEDYRGTIDSLLLAAAYLVSTATNLSVGNELLAKQEYDNVGVLLDNASYDTAIK